MRSKQIHNLKVKGLILVCSALSLCACLQDTIQPDILQDYDPKLVLNGTFGTDSELFIIARPSVSILDTTFPTGLDNVKITYTTSKGDKGSFIYDLLSEGYTSSLKAESGDILRVRGEHPDFPTVFCEVRIPDSVSTSATLVPNGGIDTSGLEGDLISLTFFDKPGQKNYYRLQILYWNGFAFIPILNPRIDPSLAEYNSLRLQDASILFTDDLFDGKEKTTTIVATNGLTFGLPQNQDKYKIEFASLSSDYYEYFASLDRAVKAKEVTFQGGFNNAVVIHSNVNNGLGILATEWRSDITLK